MLIDAANQRPVRESANRKFLPEDANQKHLPEVANPRPLPGTSDQGLLAETKSTSSCNHRNEGKSLGYPLQTKNRTLDELRGG